MQVSITYPKKGKDKVKVTIHSQDFWSGDITLARVIYPFLKQYRARYNRKNHPMGYPSDFMRGDIHAIYDGANDDAGLQDWLLTLDKMIYSFGHIARIKPDEGPEWENFSKEAEVIIKAHAKELADLRRQDKVRFAALTEEGALNSLYFDRRQELMQPLYEKYDAAFKDHRARLQEGIDLFAKYFRSLWE